MAESRTPRDGTPDASAADTVGVGTDAPGPVGVPAPRDPAEPVTPEAAGAVDAPVLVEPPAHDTAPTAGAARAAVKTVGLLLVCYLVLSIPFVAVALAVGLVLEGFGLFGSADALLIAEITVAATALVAELAGPRRLPAGLAVSRRDQPRLWALVDDVAATLDVPPPDGIVVTGGTPADLRSVRRPGITLRHYLVLGAAVPVVLDEDRLRGVVAHALAHRRRRRPPLADRIAVHGRDAVAGLADSAAGRGALGEYAERFAARYERVSAPVLALEERRADRYAARRLGAEQLADSLDALRGVREAWHRYRTDFLDAGFATGCVPLDPLGGLRAMLGDPQSPDRSPEAQQSLTVTVDGDLHGLAGRAARLRDLSQPVGVPAPRDEQPAPGRRGPLVLDEAARLEAHLHAYLLAGDEDGVVAAGGFAVLDDLPALDADAYIRHVHAYRAAGHANALALAARRAGAPFPVTLGGVLDLLADGKGPKLADTYADQGHRVGAGHATLEAALADLVACAWAETGRVRWSGSWGGAEAVVRRDGTGVDLVARVAGAVGSAEAAVALRDGLRADGVLLHFEPQPPVSFAGASERETAAGRR